MKNSRTIKKEKSLQMLNMLERKNKFNSNWDNDVRIAFNSTESFSFTELVDVRLDVAEKLITKYRS